MKQLFFAIPVLILLGCNPVRSVKDVFTNLSPYERYVKNLETANLHERPMAKHWIAAGERAMRDSIRVILPINETGQFLSHNPEARAYRFDARDGQILSVNGTTTATHDTHIFSDLFILKNNKWKHVASADSSFVLSYEFNQNAVCLLRIQPELLVNAYYSITISLTPVLINPVSGASNKSIQSFYGDSRDGGKRLHEGVDIFARKGTPVIAPTDGVVTRTGNTRLGGKVVWMYDRKRQHSYYFAHLDSQYVAGGEVVRQGDTLGVVGNTGNARFTPPHLHFGIYQSRSKDPLHYIRTLEDVVDASPLDTTFEVNIFRVADTKPVLKSGPGPKHQDIQPLAPGTFLRVIAQSSEWYRVSLGDRSEGYVLKKAVVPAQTGKIVVLDRVVELRLEPSADSVVIDFLKAESVVQVLASHGSQQYVKTALGTEGWILL
jgi:peptidoglycan LD-endopeptidase LytH